MGYLRRYIKKKFATKNAQFILKNMSRNDNLDLVTQKVGSFSLWFLFEEYIGLREILVWECCLWYIPFVGKGILYVREIYFEVGGLRCVVRIDGNLCLEKITCGKKKDGLVKEWIGFGGIPCFRRFREMRCSEDILGFRRERCCGALKLLVYF